MVGQDLVGPLAERLVLIRRGRQIVDAVGWDILL
jgi:hypothetical protein